MRLSAHRSALALLADTGLFPFEQACAQTASGTEATQSSELTDIMVTAQRRTENSQTVPVAIEHIDAKAIENAGYTDATSLQYLAPGLQYDPTNGASFQIRGVGSQSFDFSNAKSIDDDVIDGQRTSGLVDLANIDILMGPQGTLFGMSERVELGVYARNLFNQGFSTGWIFSGAIGYLHYTSPNARRTVGGFVNFKFRDFALLTCGRRNAAPVQSSEMHNDRFIHALAA